MTKTEETRLRNLTAKQSEEALEGNDATNFARLTKLKKLEALSAAKKTPTIRKR